jgi:hypothetical protein
MLQQDLTIGPLGCSEISVSYVDIHDGQNTEDK